MPIIANSDLPSFKRIQTEGEVVLSKEIASKQDIRGLNFGILNMMPDAALEATERQFLRLIGGSQVVQLYVFPFTLKTIERSKNAKNHIDKYYYDFEKIKNMGLDGLIITGAGVDGENIKKQKFYQELEQVVSWAVENVASTLCSCLATHAVMEMKFQQKRHKMPKKYWGVFHHNITEFKHPLLSGINSDFAVPHSRYNEITASQFTDADIKILIKSDSGVHMAISPDLLKIVFFQGHPEYDTISLLKEYKREMILSIKNDTKYPVFPDNYLSKQAKAILLEFKDKLLNMEFTIDDFPEKLLSPMLSNTWSANTKIIISNWIGLIYQTTNVDVKKQFMDGLSAENPLNLKV